MCVNSTADGDLDFSRATQSVPARAVSVAWEWDDQGLFVGNADGMIRRYDTTGQARSPIVVERRGSIEPPIVWCLKVSQEAAKRLADLNRVMEVWEGRMDRYKLMCSWSDSVRVV